MNEREKLDELISTWDTKKIFQKEEVEISVQADWKLYWD